MSWIYDIGIELESLFKRLHPCTPIIATDIKTSEMVKLVSNAWLSLQVAFWNDIRTLSRSLHIDAQQVANLCTLDKRISKYGTKMTGEKINGMCLPKDIKQLQDVFSSVSINSNLLKSIEEYVEDS